MDDVKFQTGLATCRNFEVLPHGPVRNRAGFAFVRAAKITNRQARLIPFTFSTTQTMVLEFGHLYVRFHTMGATLESSPGVPYEVATPYAEHQLFSLKFVQSADVLTIVHPDHAPAELRRLGALSWPSPPSPSRRRLPRRPGSTLLQRRPSPARATLPRRVTS